MQIKTFQTKITFWAGICLLSTAIIIVSFSAITMKARANAMKSRLIIGATKYAEAVAKQYANYIRAEIEISLDASRTLAHSLSGIKDKNINLEIDRNEVNGILKIVLAQNKSFHGIFTCWETNEFDQMDRGFVGEQGHDETGRFIPYWTRDQSNFVVKPLENYSNEGVGDYYLIPKKQKKEYILSITGKLNEKEIHLLSVVAPIIVDDNFYGVVGIESYVTNIQKETDSVKDLYDGTAIISVINHSDVLIASTGHSELAGKKMGDIHDSIHSVHSKDHNDYLEVETSFNVGKTDQPWKIEVAVPMSKITEAADIEMKNTIREMIQMIAINTCCAVIALLILWFIAKGVANPMQSIVSGISNGVDTLINSSNEISMAIEKQFTIVSQQSASVSEITGTMSELLATSTHIADHSQSVVDIANSAFMVTKQGAESVDKIKSKMNEINKDNERNIKEIVELGKKSKEITRVMELINNITDQTKLIAFNAALEASSAGEAGKRFGVVAVEIRRLADSVMESTRETEVKINEIQETVNRMIIDSEKGSKGIQQGMEYSNNIVDKFNHVISGTQATLDAAKQISLSTQQQKSASEQIITSLREIDDGGRIGTDSMNQIREVTKDLLLFSTKLQTMVSEFKARFGG